MTPEAIRDAGFEPHVPGEPCPVGRRVEVQLLHRSGEESESYVHRPPYNSDRAASCWGWGHNGDPGDIIGWRYAHPADAQREIARLRERVEKLEAGPTPQEVTDAATYANCDGQTAARAILGFLTNRAARDLLTENPDE